MYEGVLELSCKEASAYVCHRSSGGTQASWEALPQQQKAALIQDDCAAFLQRASGCQLDELEVSPLLFPCEALPLEELRARRAACSAELNGLLDVLSRATPDSLGHSYDDVRKSSAKCEKAEVLAEQPAPAALDDVALCEDMVQQILSPYPVECEAGVAMHTSCSCSQHVMTCHQLSTP